jgi:F-type H+-transporting ATPase subunit c
LRQLHQLSISDLEKIWNSVFLGQKIPLFFKTYWSKLFFFMKNQIFILESFLFLIFYMLVTAAKLIGGGAAAAGVGGAGAGIGAVFAGFVIGLSRNPSLEQVMFRFTILGFALSEATALFALIMSFLILFTFLFLKRF